MEDAGARTSDAAAFSRALSHLAPHIKAAGGSQPVFAPYKLVRFEDQVRILLDANVPAFSFVFGIPPTEILDEARRRGIVTLGTATTRDEATALEERLASILWLHLALRRADIAATLANS
jgi:nitronate monooxygenase